MALDSFRVSPGIAVTAGTLAGLAALHVAWGLGSPFPCPDRETLADTVAGTSAVPGKPECFAVASALFASAVFVADVVPVERRVRIPIVGCAAVVLGVRGAAGLVGKTSLIVSWTTSQRFNRLDRHYYGPLCLALATGAVRSLRVH